MSEYYTVFNLTENDPRFSIGLKQPGYSPDSADNIVPAVIKKNPKTVLIICLVFISVSIIAFCLIHRKKKR